MTEINLYPTGGKQKTGWRKVIKVFGSINMIVTVIFFVVALLFVVFFVLNQSAINRAKAREEEYRNKIKALSQTEFQYLFLKDRVRKIGEILQSRKVVKNLEEFNSILNSIDDVVLGDVELSGGKLSFTATALTYSALENLMASIQRMQSYQKGVVSSLGFSPQNGYKLEVKLE